MGLFDFLKHSSSDSKTQKPLPVTTVHGSKIIYGIKNLNNTTLLALQKLCVPGTKKLSLSADKIIFTCDSILTQHNAILDDCKELVYTTDNPNTFFSRYDLLLEHLQAMAAFEPYVQFYGYQPQESLEYYSSHKDQYVKKMIDRRYNKALIKADSLKTEKGKKNQFVKAYDELKSFSDALSPDNLKYLENKFKNKV